MAYAHPGFMSPSQAAHIAKRARKLLRSGELTHHQIAVLDSLLWDLRKHGSDKVTATYRGLQKMARVCRQTVAEAIAAFVRLGLLRKFKMKVLVLWANGGRKWQQQPNSYQFCCESTERTEYPKDRILILNSADDADAKAAQQGLAAIAARRAAALGLGKPLVAGRS